MRKQDIINEVTKFTCKHANSLNDVIVSHGGACVLHGVMRDTKDIDLYVTDEIWEKHVSLGFVPILKNDGVLSIQATSDISIRTGCKEVWSDALKEQNILYQSAQQTIFEYIRLQRKKDYKKIANLQKIVG